MEKYIQVITTLDSEEKAKKIAMNLLEDRLAACVQIVGPIKSLCIWHNNIEEEYYSEQSISLLATSVSGITT